jgi:putative ABC transport system ATP-binding protein
MSVLSIRNVSFAYDRRTPVLRNLSLDFEQGKTYAIIGRSGAGKTTLLSIMAGLLKPVKGDILFNDHSITGINQFVYRSRDVGVVFQSYNLLPKMTAIESVILSMDVAKVRHVKKKETARALLTRVGLTETEMNRRVLLLSGGQQQRVAIARAMVGEPKILLADEPTGALDTKAGIQIMQLFQELHKEGATIIMITHEVEVAECADKIVMLRDGKILEEHPGRGYVLEEVE